MDISFSAVTNDSVSHTIFLYGSDTDFTGAGSVLLTLGGTQTPAGDGNTVQGRAWGWNVKRRFPVQRSQPARQ
jgi:hypothetical protein